MRLCNGNFLLVHFVAMLEHDVFSFEKKQDIVITN